MEQLEEEPEEEPQQQEKETEQQEQGEVEKRAPEGDWWGRIYTFDEVSEMVDNLDRRYQKGMKRLAPKKGGKGSKTKGGKMSK